MVGDDIWLVTGRVSDRASNRATAFASNMDNPGRQVN
jgi:hypothetical protein